MTLATCNDCGTRHSHGARPFRPDEHLTTLCPSCGSTSYRSISTDSGLSEADVLSLLRSTRGMGATTIERLKAHAGTLSRVQSMSVEQLMAVDGIGRQTAENVVDNFT